MTVIECEWVTVTFLSKNISERYDQFLCFRTNYWLLKVIIYSSLSSQKTFRTKLQHFIRLIEKYAYS